MTTHSREFLLPDVGEGLTEAEIVRWLVAVGDTIRINDIIVEIETAKSIVELPSPFDGIVASLPAAEGTMVEVGKPIIVVEVEGSDPDHTRSDSGSPGEGRTPILVGFGPRTVNATRRPRKAPATTALPVKAAPARALATPPVRKLAKDLGVDLDDVVSSNVSGRITRDDVQAHAGRVAPALTPRPVVAVQRVSAEGEERVPIKGVRKMTAQAMVSSAFSAPHVTGWVTVDITRTVELVGRLKQDRAFSDVRVSVLLILAKAVCHAMRRTPVLNSSWDEEAQEIVYKRHVNLGIAAATERGLLVPNIRAAESLSLRDLAQALGQLVDTAREGRTQPSEMSGGTFTITNFGVFGIDGGTPILNPGEAGIMALGAIARRPWVVENGGVETIEPRWVTTIAMSSDHRMVDGEHSSRFIADVAAILNDPAAALLC